MDCLTLGLLLAVAVSIRWEWFFGQVSWANSQDNTNLFLPVFSAISARFAAGEIPTCLPGIVGGLRLDACPHFHILYPFYFLYLDIYSSPLRCAVAVHRIILLHYLLLAANTYFLARILSFRPCSAAVASLAFISSVAVQSEMPWVTIIAATTWFPLVVGGLHLVLLGRSRIGVPILTFSAVLLILAQPGQQMIIAFATCALLCLGNAVLIRTTPTDLRNKCISILLAFVGVAFVVGPYLFTLDRFHSNAIRWLGEGFGHIVGAEKIPAAALAAHGLQFRDAINVLYLSKPHTVIGHIFLGPTLAALLVIGLIRACSVQGRWFLPFALLPVFFAFFSFSWVAEHITYYLPLFSKIREATYFGIPATLFGILCAIFGLEILTSSRIVFTRPKWLLVPLALVILTSIAFSAVAEHNYTPTISLTMDMLLPGIISVASIFLAYFYIRSASNRLSEMFLSVGVLLGAFAPLVNKPALMTANDANSSELIDADSVLWKLATFNAAIDHTRVDMPMGTLIDWSMQGLYFGLASFQGYWQPQDFTQFTRLYWIRNRVWAARMAGLRFRITQMASPTRADCETLARLGKWSLLRDLKANPRIYTESGIAGFYENDDDYFRKVEVAAGNVRGIWLPAHTGGLSPARLAPTERKARTKSSILIELSSDESVRLRVDFEQPTVLVLNEYRELGWKASVDGNNQSTFAVNLTQTAVLVENGHHSVIFYMNSWTRRLSQMWPLISCGALATFFCAALRLRRTQHAGL
jgi:hypothetical protein